MQTFYLFILSLKIMHLPGL